MGIVSADRWIRPFLAAVALCTGLAAGPALAGTVKVAVLKFGTVNWELDVIRTHRLDRAEGVDLQILELAGKDATTIALQAGEADMIVTDWLWVSRQRAEGARYAFVPYSTALGAIIVPAGSPIQGLADLAGKRLGIAGGPLDKSWLLIRGLAQEQAGLDLDGTVEKVFGAPPLLNEQILAGRLDAVLNFWHYAARLEAAGLRRLLGVEEAARGLGIDSDVPLVGYVFDEDWAAANEKDVQGFVRATRAAKRLLADSDAEWERLRPLMKAEDDATFRALREGYRRGIPGRWGERERAAAGQMFSLLAKLGGRQLVGKGEVLQDGTFWAGVSY